VRNLSERRIDVCGPHTPSSGPAAGRTPVVKHRNPNTEESISVRRLVSRPPFPGQSKRHPFQAGERARSRIRPGT